MDFPKANNNENKNICIVIPAYNEAEVITGVLNELLGQGYRVVVVDDGSTDGTYERCLPLPVDLLRHPVNLGYGGAQQTGLKYAARLKVDVIVTFDADGQHICGEIPKLVAPVLAGEVDVALGSRFLGTRPERMPASRALLLRLAVLFTRFTTGLRLTDAHNGMRAFARHVIASMDLHQNGMAYSSELLAWLAHSGLRWKEVPVCIRYTKYSLNKGQSMWNLFNILLDLITS